MRVRVDSKLAILGFGIGTREEEREQFTFHQRAKTTIEQSRRNGSLKSVHAIETPDGGNELGPDKKVTERRNVFALPMPPGFPAIPAGSGAVAEFFRRIPCVSWFPVSSEDSW